MPKQTNSLPIVRPVEELPSPTAPKIGKDLEGLFSNKEQLVWLIFLMKEYVHRLETAQTLCMRVLNYKRTIYLLDFDVIRNFLEMKSLEQVDTFVVDFLFFDSKVQFAIPVGAFEELLAYLALLAKTGYQMSRLDKDYEREEAIKFISAALEIENFDELTTDELIDEIGGRLEESILELSRLLELLRNPRFRGIKTKFDNKCHHAWLNVIKTCKRAHWERGKPHSKVDSRDAMNLSVASRTVPSVKALTQMTPEEYGVCYLLVSQTGVVIDMKRRAESKQEFGELCSYLCAEHVRQLGGVSPLHNLMEVKC